MHGGFGTQVAQHPFDITGGRQLARPTRVVTHPQNRIFYGSIERNIDGELGENVVFAMFEYAIAKAVTCQIIACATAWQWCRRPEFSALFIAQIKGFTTFITDRIVGPGSEPKFMCIFAPAIRLTTFGNDRPEVGVGNDIAPWRRSIAIVTADDLIFTAIGAEAADAIFKQRRWR